MTTKETKPDKVNNELILYRLDEIKQQLTEIKEDYVTKTEFNELRREVHELKKRNNLIGWLYPTASAAFAALITYLLIEFFKTR